MCGHAHDRLSACKSKGVTIDVAWLAGEDLQGVAAKVVSTDTVPAAIYSPCWSEKACKDQFSKAAQAPASVEETAGHPDRKRGMFGQFGLPEEPWESVVRPVHAHLRHDNQREGQ